MPEIDFSSPTATIPQVDAERQKQIGQLCGQVMLPFGGRSWTGASGAWRGRNQGSSIDYYDHRVYVPGDDPRHLDWAAFARTNLYIMKLFSEEVSPRLDVALDTSRSMALTATKEARSLDLFLLILNLAEKANLSTKVFAFETKGQVKSLEHRSALRLEHLPDFPATPAAKPARKDNAPVKSAKFFPLAEIPWRPGSLRVLICDLLTPHSPEAELASMMDERARIIILAPFLADECNPAWQGNLEMQDCESQEMRRQRVEPWLLGRYRESYRRHFEMWEETARKKSVRLARVPVELPLIEAVRKHVLPSGALEARA